MGDFSIIGGGPFALSDGYDASNTQGQAIVSSSSTDTLGSPVELLSAANNTYTSEWVMVCVLGVAAVESRFLVNILLGATSSEVVIIPNLWCSNSGNAVTTPHIFKFPIRIPTGQRISANCQATGSSQTIHVHLIRGPATLANSRGLASVFAIGADTANTKGTTVAASTVNAFGTIVELDSSLDHDIEGFIVTGFKDGGSWGTARMNYEIMVGASLSEEVIFSGYTFGVESGETALTAVSPFIDVSIAEGERISIQSKSSLDDADADLDYVMYGVR